jgi:hypothetical protein
MDDRADGAPSHTAATAIACPNDMIKVLTDWLARLPDLNPMEYMCTILKHRLEQLRPGAKKEVTELL